MEIDFLLPVLCGGVLFSFTIAPIGTFVLWRRMANISDTMAHAALLGIVLSLLTNLPILLGMITIGILLACFLLPSHTSSFIPNEAKLTYLMQSALALALVLIHTFRLTVDVEQWLFGDILLLDWYDISLLAILALVIYSWTLKRFKYLLLSSLHDALLPSYTISAKRLQLEISLLLALLIMTTIKITGALLVGSFLITPSLIARYRAHTPLKMMLGSGLAAIFAFLLGLGFSFWFDTPAGPSMVVMLSIMLTSTHLLDSCWKK